MWRSFGRDAPHHSVGNRNGIQRTNESEQGPGACAERTGRDRGPVTGAVLGGGAELQRLAIQGSEDPQRDRGSLSTVGSSQLSGQCEVHFTKCNVGLRFEEPTTIPKHVVGL